MKKNLNRYVEEVMFFSKALNLTSIHDSALFYERFIEPSVKLASFLPEQGRLLDVGSGMGVPGIPIVISKPEIQGVLVERRKKRAEFIRHVSRKLDLKLEVHASDINKIPSLEVNLCVARAVSKPDVLLKMFTQHCITGALAVFPVAAEARPKDQAGWVFEEEYRIMSGPQQQRIHQYRYGEH
ncbi:MAG: class I SAM-dependent methyltransferase [Mariprofundaceae bacterium]|nr:class I SAM-dependent methyltransferase [Mariprofundaceae bacterium]